MVHAVVGSECSQPNATCCDDRTEREDDGRSGRHKICDWCYDNMLASNTKHDHKNDQAWDPRDSFVPVESSGRFVGEELDLHTNAEGDSRKT